MKFLVTGASGFIGKEVVKLIKQNGTEEDWITNGGASKLTKLKPVPVNEFDWKPLIDWSKIARLM